MKKLSARIKTLLAATALTACCAAAGAIHPANAAPQAPAWQKTAVIYCVNPEIFSSHGLAGVTAQLPRLKALGVNVLWLMPFQPIGQAGVYAGQQRPTYQSRYCMSDLKGIDPREGTVSDLKTLVGTAHENGMHIIMDVALNQTSWDSPLLESHPEYYYHTDNNPKNVNSIDLGFPNGFRDKDIAAIDLRTDQYGAQTYMKGVLKYWLGLGFDGFRFDSSDSPKGATRDLGRSYAESLYDSLNPTGKYMWLEEGESPELALQPYTLDYDWDVAFYHQYGPEGDFTLQNVAKTGAGFAAIPTIYDADAPGGQGLGDGGFPTGIQHMIMLQDWDTDEDYVTCGGFPQVLDAAAFNLTIPGVPLIYNGEEAGNDAGGNNTHAPIDWTSPNAAQFTAFYTAMLASRNSIPALQQGSLTWETNSNNSNNVATYARTSGASEVYVEINFSNAPQSGTCTVPTGAGPWTDISPSVSPGGTSHTLPSTGNYSLAPFDYAVFKRG